MPATLDPGESMRCRGTYTVTQQDLATGHVDLTVQAASDETGEVEDDATVLTLPPTDTPGGHTGGAGLPAALLGLAVLAVAVQLLAPAPGRRRRMDR